MRSLSRAAHRNSVSTLGSTRLSSTVRPLATTVAGRAKSNVEGESSSVNCVTPCVCASKTLPRRFTSTRPDGLLRGKIGAGGLSNAIPELLHDSGVGGVIDLDKVPSDDPSLSPLQLWCNESQERYVLGLPQERVAEFAAICLRERCPFAVVGTATQAQRSMRSCGMPLSGASMIWCSTWVSPPR